MTHFQEGKRRVTRNANGFMIGVVIDEEDKQIKQNKCLKGYDLGVSIPVSRCQSNINMSYQIRIQYP